MVVKAILQYTDCLGDGKNVFNTLAQHNVSILKTTTPCFSICPKITIKVESYPFLNELVSALNRNCIYEVRVVKTKVVKG